ncbi:N-formylglutamate deformylase [Ideonella sp. 4Y11]|uniref:N-formylglutamate deformylase n=1 Tax=Ideonella aquatica TaxID=2824119 RepID=A0A940YQG9_9BURK|nr:N-formylglutamate deformylase [Ideonella aquatica]MBQ0957595.1 N-formylglutamate deformylase [Ideonella aquatica]
MTHPVFTLHRGHRPLLVSVPHAGTALPLDQQPRYTERALRVEDTDWCLDELYAFARDLGASLIVPRHSRYLIDLNRPPTDAPMYPGANNTELCPTRNFEGLPIYRDGQAPDAAEIHRRRERYWQPYHDSLASELERLRAEHGHALLFDGHSIRPELPWLFDGRLPDLNLGTANGQAATPALRDALRGVLATQDRFSWVVDGRFKGGYITRHYGQPAQGVQAVQLEMGWQCAMDEAMPTQGEPRLDASRVARLQPVLDGLLRTMLAHGAAR